MLATLEPDVRTLEAETRSSAKLENRHEVSVKWTDDGSRDGKWELTPKDVNVRTPAAQILYTFTEDTPEGMVFRVSPVLWIEPAAPDNFAVQLTDETRRQVSVVDANFTTGPVGEAFGFRLLAVYKNQTRMSHDPTIINWDPS